MSYVIFGRRILNEHLALGTIGATGLLSFLATRGGSDKKEEAKSTLESAKEKTENIFEDVKSKFGAASKDEESYIQEFIKKMEKEDSHAKH